MTEERRKQLEAERQTTYLLDQEKKVQGKLIDGVKKIEETMAAPEPQPLFAPTKFAPREPRLGGR